MSNSFEQMPPKDIEDERCPDCAGSGYTDGRKCKRCSGTGVKPVGH